MRKYRILLSFLFLMIPVAFIIGVLSGQEDVIKNQVITNNKGYYESEYNGKTYHYRNQVMNEINNQIDLACGQDPYCRDLFIKV